MINCLRALMKRITTSTRLCSCGMIMVFYKPSFDAERRSAMVRVVISIKSSDQPALRLLVLKGVALPRVTKWIHQAGVKKALSCLRLLSLMWHHQTSRSWFEVELREPYFCNCVGGVQDLSRPINLTRT